MNNEQLTNEIKNLFEAIPETINFPNSNLWGVICEGVCNLQETTAQEFINSIISGHIPSQHSVAAAVSMVRKSNNKYQLTDEGKESRLKIKQKFAEDYKNQLNINTL